MSQHPNKMNANSQYATGVTKENGKHFKFKNLLN